MVQGLLDTLDVSETTCGYHSCHPFSETKINVHLVPHTHDDVGWLKTLDQYYYGSNTRNQYAGVQYILDSVIQELKKDPAKRFIYVETAFFWKWWKEQNDATRHQVKKLVHRGQLEFIGGAWSMNDEAAAHYHSIIDQFTWGLRKLNDTFGQCGRPKAGWQIDPFGHSKEMASLFALMGYDGLFLGRIDYQDKENRFKNREAEMVWRGSHDLPIYTSDIFTTVLYNTYGPPPGLCFDIFCQDDPIIDDPNSPDYNVNSRLDDLFAYLDNMTKVYTSPNLLITMGEDFHYQNAHTWYKNLDKLIKYGNARNDSKYHLFYSTPTCYLKGIWNFGGGLSTYPVKNDDFFPYASDPHAYWTGYFTSRPTSKRFERDGNNFLQVCKQLATLADIDNEIDLNALREAMGVFQHHDAITGTEKQHVADDYHRLLHAAIGKCQQLTNEALSKLTRYNGTFESCLLRNISSCGISETEDSFVVTVYNPSSWPVSELVHLPVTGKSYTVTNKAGAVVKSQLLPIPDTVLKIPGRKSSAIAELYFLAENLPPLGYSSFLVKKISGNQILKERRHWKSVVSFHNLGIKLDKETGLISHIRVKNKIVHVSQTFAIYRGFVGDNKLYTNRSSGAYIFRPIANKTLFESAKIKVYDGDVVKEIHQIFNNYTSQIVRFSNIQDNLFEFQWLVGPLPDSEKNGYEIVSVFQTNLTNNGQFFTDSNGRQTINRTLNERPTWKLNLSEPIAGNYYPVTSRIGFVDEEENIRLSIITDRAQGGSSLEEGNLELMVHRKCIHDDAFGVAEPLNETAFNQSLVARGSHYLIVGNLHNVDKESQLARQKILKPWIFLSKSEQNFGDFSPINYRNMGNVQILTLEPWKEGTILLRLEHILETNPYSSANDQDINIKDLLGHHFNLVSFTETNLAANMFLKEERRPLFNLLHDLQTNFSDERGFNKRQAIIDAGLNEWTITLQPMQIRTFIVKIKRN